VKVCWNCWWLIIAWLVLTFMRLPAQTEALTPHLLCYKYSLNHATCSQWLQSYRSHQQSLGVSRKNMELHCVIEMSPLDWCQSGVRWSFVKFHQIYDVERPSFIGKWKTINIMKKNKQKKQTKKIKQNKNTKNTINKTKTNKKNNDNKQVCFCFF
jgi:hypothetical protein